MNRKLILTLIAVILCGSAFSQIVKYRVGGNYGKFNNEIGADEIEHPLVTVLSNPNATDFTHAFEPGFEGEVMLLWSPNIETGLELEFTKFSGNNDIPPYYNYYFAPDNPSVITTTEPLMYESSATNLILNFRYYFAPDGTVNPFFKVYGGMSWVGTELNYADQTFITENETGVLYALGTSNSSDSKESVICYGAGAGFDFELSENMSVYIDGTAGIIGSDKLDGIPNYDYINTDGQETLKPVGNKAFIAQISLGIVFTSKTDLGLNKNFGNKKKGSGVKRTGRTTPWRPFYRQK